MKTFSATTTIHATVDAIWAILTDAPGHAGWNPEVTKLEGSIAAGEKITVHKETDPKTSTVKVTTFDPPRRLAFSGSGGMPELMLKAERTYTLTPRDGGVVEVSQQLVFTGIMSAVILKNVPDQQPVLEAVGEALKRRAEQA